MVEDSIRVYGIASESIVDGPGMRFAIFVQGCTHACPGCHNPESHPHCGGVVYTIEELLGLVTAGRIIHDVTLSGGEPFEQPEACAELARRLKAQGYGVWAYTGYRYEDIRDWQDGYGADVAQTAPDGSVRNLREVQTRQAMRGLLDAVDVLVDGPFVESKKSLELQWRGSSNQRVINVAAMREAGDEGTIIPWKRRYQPPEKPRSW